jgi:hypothetical protein
MRVTEDARAPNEAAGEAPFSFPGTTCDRSGGTIVCFWSRLTGAARTCYFAASSEGIVYQATV